MSNRFKPFLIAARNMQKYNKGNWHSDNCPTPTISETSYQNLRHDDHLLAEDFLQAYEDVKGTSFKQPKVRKLLQELIHLEDSKQKIQNFLNYCIMETQGDDLTHDDLEKLLEFYFNDEMYCEGLSCDQKENHKQEKPAYCEWVKDDSYILSTGCGEDFYDASESGNPVTDWLNYCPYCGRKVKEK